MKRKEDSLRDLIPSGTVVKNLPVNASDASLTPGLGRSPRGGMATHSIILAWTVPWTDEPGRLQSIVSQSQTRQKCLSTRIMKIKKNSLKDFQPESLECCFKKT